MTDAGPWCIRCGRPVADRGTLCPRCAAVQARYSARRYDAREAAGVCAHCGGAPLATRRLCAACAQREREDRARLYRDRRERGLCGDCGAPAVAGKSLCARHLQAAADRMWAQRHLGPQPRHKRVDRETTGGGG